MCSINYICCHLIYMTSTRDYITCYYQYFNTSILQYYILLLIYIMYSVFAAMLEDEMKNYLKIKKRRFSPDHYSIPRCYQSTRNDISESGGGGRLAVLLRVLGFCCYSTLHQLLL